jgi:hypothetical protein
MPSIAVAQVAFNNRGINACADPSVKDYMVGDGISQGITFRPCPNYVPPVVATPAPAPVNTPAPTPVDTPAPAQDDTPAPAADNTPSPTTDNTPTQQPVYTPPPPPPPPQRIPVAVPVYTPWNATVGPGSTAVGSSNGSNSYNNPYASLAPSARAAVGGADWCRRSGRSSSATDACLKSVGNR